jgi:ABC-type sugar transport system ATPase subunit
MQTSIEPLLALQGVTKRFGSLLALSDASLDIMLGEVHCIRTAPANRPCAI